VYQWGKRNLLPPPEGLVGGSPAWHSSTIEAWAQQTGRMPGIRQAILDVLLTVAGLSVSPIADKVIALGFARTTGQVLRALGDLFDEGLIGRKAPDHWYITDVGKQVVSARPAGTSKLWDDNAKIPAVYVPTISGSASPEANHRRVEQASYRWRRGRR
jgi:hypothetical protein